MTACDLGLSVLRLETGDRQHEAVSLYLALGWERVSVTLKERPFPPGGTDSART